MSRRCSARRSTMRLFAPMIRFFGRGGARPSAHCSPAHHRGILPPWHRHRLPRRFALLSRRLSRCAIGPTRWSFTTGPFKRSRRIASRVAASLGWQLTAPNSGWPRNRRNTRISAPNPSAGARCGCCSSSKTHDSSANVRSRPARNRSCPLATNTAGASAALSIPPAITGKLAGHWNRLAAHAESVRVRGHREYVFGPASPSLMIVAPTLWRSIDLARRAFTDGERRRSGDPDFDALSRVAGAPRSDYGNCADSFGRRYRRVPPQTSSAARSAEDQLRGAAPRR